LHGTTLSQVENISGVFNRAARQLLLDIDPQETKRIEQLASPIFYQVYDYAPPADLKGQKIIDIFPQVNRMSGDRLSQTYNQNFDLHKSSLLEEFTIVHNKGAKTLRLSFNDNSKCILINSASDKTSNGTWATSGTATNLLVNTSTVINGAPALQFDVTAGTGYLTNSTMTAVDLTAHAGLATGFFEVYLYPASSVTSINIRIGSDSSNYYEETGITTNYQGNAFVDGWNTIGITGYGGTTHGTPVISAIKYLRLGVVASSTIYGAQLAQIWSKIGQIMNCEYYSKYLFSTVGGVWQETTTDDSDLINLDTESYNIYFYLLQLFATQQALGQDASYDTSMSSNWYQQAVARYKRMYKSEISKPQQMYYRRTNRRHNDYFGNWSNN
jgi:hypothetical protein